MKTNFNELAKEVYHRNIQKGFWDGGIEAKNIGEVLMLMVTELAEACEAHRKNHHAVKSWNLEHNCNSIETTNEKLYFQQEFEVAIKNSFEDEMADVIIRVMDLCGAMNIDIDYYVEQKMKYNLLRPYKHNKAY